MSIASGSFTSCAQALSISIHLSANAYLMSVIAEAVSVEMTAEVGLQPNVEAEAKSSE